MALSDSSAQALGKFKHKVDKELSMFPGVELIFDITPKSKKQTIISMSLFNQNQLLLEQSMSTKSWDTALEQCVQDALWSLKQQFAMHHMQIKRTPIMY
jgi:hypothetical protein